MTNKINTQYSSSSGIFSPVFKIILMIFLISLYFKACLITTKPKPDFETVSFVSHNWNQIRETVNPAQELDFRFQDGDCHGNR